MGQLSCWWNQETTAFKTRRREEEEVRIRVKIVRTILPASLSFPSSFLNLLIFCFHFTHSHQFFSGAQEKFMTQYKFEPILTAIFYSYSCFHVNVLDVFLSFKVEQISWMVRYSSSARGDSVTLLVRTLNRLNLWRVELKRKKSSRLHVYRHELEWVFRRAKSTVKGAGT